MTLLWLVALVFAVSLPDIPPGWSVVLVALIGGPIMLWVQSIRGQRAAEAAKENAEVAREAAARIEQSVGPKNGHGTVQDATGELLAALARIEQRMDRFERSTATSLDSIVGAAHLVNERLKAHDRELAEHKRRMDDIETKESG